ncbi:MAG TPA: TlpA disulfide reductase family protein [Dyella sp.]|uniref:peroxiredoxin family protein n=1 Tax=Dyella sp. TaxID=1869338 RepID=UPI002D795A05|nr:TlpA disulfide reductase family protein [Dyella sp.]HET6554194.1 TlpA disulfide reductase family protein [Dyella sp.]
MLRRLAFACLLCGLSVSCAFANELRINQPAPDIVLNTLDGQHIALHDLRGKIVIITFWATWCDPCREELPLLSRYAHTHADDDLVILGFSLDTPDTLKEVRQLASRFHFATGLLGDPHVEGYGRIWRLPVSFVVDRQGRLVYDGWKDKAPAWTQQKLDELVTPMLRAQAQ